MQEGDKIAGYKEWFLLLLLAFIWGSSFILMKLGSFQPNGSQMYTPNQLAALRMGIAGVVMLPFVYRDRRFFRSKKIYPLLIVSFIGSGLPAFLFAIAITKLYSSYTGMLNALTPIFALVISMLLFNAKPSKANIIGITIGFIGATALILSDKGVGESENLWYALLIVLATLCYGISANTIRNYLSDVPSITISATSFFFVSIPYIIYLFLGTDFNNRIANIDYATEGLIYISILSIVGTAFAVYLYSVLIKRSSILFASSVTYIIPVFAIIWGVFLDGDPITPWHIVSLLIVFSGVYLVNKKK